MLFGRCDSAPEVRRRAQQLTVLECALLFYRALISTPVWFQYFEDTHLGSILTSSCTGGPCFGPAFAAAVQPAVGK